MNKPQSVSDATFEGQVLNSQKPVLVDFWAAWCAPCHAIAPILEDIAKEHGDKIDVVKLSTEENTATPAKYQITSIPTLMLFVDGEVHKTMIGMQSKLALEMQLEDYLK